MSDRKELPKTYDPAASEGRLYEFWQEGGFFGAKVDPDKKPFSIVMPPPNVTGQLHMGHAMDCTLQDILIRAKRMQGYSALWVPGTDHAGIATQIKVEEALRKEGLTRYDLSGTGKTCLATGSSPSRRRWALPAIGAAPGSPWTRAAPGR